MNKLLLSGASLAMLAATAVSGVVLAEEERSWSATAELGGTMTTGNTETSTLKAKVNGIHTILDWKNEYYADVLYSEDETEKTASRWKIGAKGNYILNEKSSMFALAEYEEDEFSDYSSVSSIAGGYTRKLYQSETAFLNGDVGPGVRYFDVRDGESENTGIVHLGLVYENKLSETSKFAQVFISDVAMDSDKSTISRSETSLTANVFGELAMKLGFIVRHDNHPGVDKDEVDTETTITLLYAF